MNDSSADAEIFIHETACVDLPCRIGRGTKIWHYCHIMAGAEIGEHCNIGQNCFIAASARLGRNVKIQNNVSIYDGCILEDDVFCGPSVVFTNIKNPRSAIVRKGQYQETRVERGASLGANCTIVCGHRIGRHALIGAGAVVTSDVPAYALMLGNPARRDGWVGRAGLRLHAVPGETGTFLCPETGERYRELGPERLEPDTDRAAPSVEAPVPIPMLDLQAQDRAVGTQVRHAVDRVLNSQRFILGDEVAAFEQEMALYTGAKHALSCASGSDALLLALLALNLQPGDEILTVPYTFFATVGAICRLGLRPVFCDIQASTFAMDPGELPKRCTPRTRAILPVHLFGQCADMEPILDFARSRGLFVIEDAAQALGSRCGNRMAGTLGDLGCYSFFPSKNLGGCGDGGLVVTNNDSWADKVRMLRVHGARQKYFHELIGLNSRLDAIQAAILRVKLPYLEAWTTQRRARAQTYRHLFAEAGLELPGNRIEIAPTRGSLVLPEEAPYGRHAYNQFVVRFHADDRDNVRAYLKSQRIATEVYYPVPAHLQRCAQSLGYGPGDFPASEQASNETIALPMFPELSAMQQLRVVGAVQEALRATSSERPASSIPRANP